MSRIEDLLRECDERSRRQYPERYAPSGEALTWYPQVCVHTSDEKRAGQCGGAWQHKRIGWEHAQAEERRVSDVDEQ